MDKMGEQGEREIERDILARDVEEEGQGRRGNKIDLM